MCKTATSHTSANVKDNSHLHIYQQEATGMTCLGWNQVIHVSTFLVITLAVLAARHLPFSAPALLVDAATFARTLEGRKRVSRYHCVRIRPKFAPSAWSCMASRGPLSSPQWLWFSWTPCVPSRSSEDATRPLPLPPRSRLRWGTSAPPR